MAKDGMNINVTGVGAASSGQAGKIDTSGIQSAIDKVSNELKKLDTTNFQKNLRDLSFQIQKSATAAINFVENMQKAESKISSTIQQSLSPGGSAGAASGQAGNSKTGNTAQGMPTSEKFTKSIGSLSDSIEKLAANIKSGGGGGSSKSGDDTTKPSGSSFGDDFKKLLAAVGVGAIIKQIGENEVLTPNRAAGGLINSNVGGNVRGAGSDLLSSYQNRIASDTGILGGGAGAGLGAAIGSFIPGVGTLIGAGLGYGLGSSVGGSIGQNKMATELPTLQRGLTSDYYSNLSKQIPQYNEFAQTQYGAQGFGGTAAFQDPYLDSRAALGKSYSRFAGGSLAPETTTNILKSLSAQGNSSPQELNITGNLLGQIARFTGKTSTDIERVYKSVEKSGMNPNEGLSKTLSLLQSGLGIKESENIIQRTSQRSEAFGAGQQSYFGATPFQQFSAQQVGKAANFDVEKFYQGNPEQARELQNLSRDANKELRTGKLGSASIRLQMLENIGITPAMGDIDKTERKAAGKDFITQSASQQKIIQTTQDAITKGAKGRESSQIVDEALAEIGKSTQSFTALGDAADDLVDAFKDAAASFGHFVQKNSPVLYHEPGKPMAQTPGGR